MPQIRWLPQFKDQLDRFVNLYLAVKEQQVSIELEIPAPEQYDLLRRQRLAAGTGPDVIALRSLAEIRQFAAAGLLGDMTGEDWFARLYPVIQDAVRIDGHVMALPLDGQAAGYLYNQQLFNALALRPAETQAEMRQNITAIRAAGKIPFLAAELTTEDAARPLLLIINALAPAANQFSFAKMNAGQCSLQDLPDLFTGIDLIQVNANADGLTTSRAVGAQRFTSGDYAMWIQGSAAAEDVLALKPDFNLGLAPWPVGNDPSQARLQFSLTLALAITAHCPNQPLAKSVVAYCLDVTSSADFFAAAQLMPLSTIHTYQPGSWLAGARDRLVSGQVNLDRDIPQGFKENSGKIMQAYYDHSISPGDTIRALDEIWFTQQDQISE